MSSRPLEECVGAFCAFPMQIVHDKTWGYDSQSHSSESLFLSSRLLSPYAVVPFDMTSPRKIKAARLTSVHYQHPDLAKAAEFLKDFGFYEARKEDSRIYFAGFGVEPYVYVAEQSPDSKRHFLGASWTVASEEDLKLAALHPNASKIEDRAGPGGGKIVTITDPNGLPVSFVYGQQLKDKRVDSEIKLSREDDGVDQNFAFEKSRRGKFRRFRAGPSPVHKLGHYGLIVPGSKYKATFDWYTSLMNLKPTDAVYDPTSGNDKTCFMHVDLGQEYSDHHVSQSCAALGI